MFKNKLIVSCQAEEGDPFNTPKNLLIMARAIFLGGAGALRVEGLKNIKLIKSEIKLPIIGLTKTRYADGRVRITGSFSEVEKLLALGCRLIAIDGTFRIRDGVTGPHFIAMVKKNYDCLIVADIATKKEAVSCELNGADYIATTLHGYTPNTVTNSDSPNFHLVKILGKVLKTPIIAEGRIKTPVQAKKMIEIGASAVTVGTVITRPKEITKYFLNQLRF